jgi:hypothetical protein
VFSGILTVKSFGHEDYETKRYNEKMAEAYKEGLKRCFINAFYFSFGSNIL